MVHVRSSRDALVLKALSLVLTKYLSVSPSHARQGSWWRELAPRRKPAHRAGLPITVYRVPARRVHTRHVLEWRPH